MNYYTGKHVNLNSYKGNKSKWQKFADFCKKPLTMIVATAVIIAGILGATFKKAFSYNYVDINKDFTSSDLGAAADLPEGIVNIALFGLDARNVNGMQSNSDSIMILSINTETAEVKLSSVMRDSLVNIEGYRPYKINAAYSWGGAPLAIKTLNKTFGLNITEYATVNLAGMADVIDAIGGIPVDLTSSEVHWANVHIKWLSYVQHRTPNYIKNAGPQTLDGKQAVAFARIRYCKFPLTGNNDDFGRTDRQRYVMEQLLNIALNMKATQYPNLIKTCLPYIETSLSFNEILSFTSLLTKDLTFKQTRIPDARYVIDAGYNKANCGSAVYYNLDYASRALHAFIYDGLDADAFIAANPIDFSGWYTPKGGNSGGGNTEQPTTPAVSSESQTVTTSSEEEPTTSSEEEPTTSSEEEPTTSGEEEPTTSGEEETSSGEEETPSAPSEETTTG